jgi:hypothetical protein
VHQHQVGFGLGLSGSALIRDWVRVGLAGLANGPLMGCTRERARENLLGLARVGAGFWPTTKQE